MFSINGGGDNRGMLKNKRWKFRNSLQKPETSKKSTRDLTFLENRKNDKLSGEARNFRARKFPREAKLACDGSCWQKKHDPRPTHPRPPRRKTNKRKHYLGTCNHHDDHDGEEQYCTYMH